MNLWTLTTVVVLDTPYHRDIAPITFPMFRAYAERWGMDWCPLLIQPAVLDAGVSPAPAGTEADYVSIQHRRELLDAGSGVVFLDSDVVIVDPTEDICETVDDSQPIGSVNGWGCVVMKSGALARAFLDSIWAMRRHYRTYQWLEQAAALELLGWDGAYPGDNQPPRYIGPTAWTRFCRELDPKWNYGPHSTQPCDNPLFMHPFGVQPYPLRLQMVQEYARVAADIALVG